MIKEDVHQMEELEPFKWLTAIENGDAITTREFP